MTLFTASKVLRVNGTALIRPAAFEFEAHSLIF